MTPLTKDERRQWAHWKRGGFKSILIMISPRNERWEVWDSTRREWIGYKGATRQEAIRKALKMEAGK